MMFNSKYLELAICSYVLILNKFNSQIWDFMGDFIFCKKFVIKI